MHLWECMLCLLDPKQTGVATRRVKHAHRQPPSKTWDRAMRSTAGQGPVFHTWVFLRLVPSTDLYSLMSSRKVLGVV